MSSSNSAGEQRDRSRSSATFDPYDQAYLTSERRSPSIVYPQQQQQQQHHYSPASPQDAPQQIAYDSMSTILEVDSEASTDATLTGDDERSSTKSPGQPLEVRTQRSLSPSQQKRPDIQQGSPVSGLSTGDGLLADKFSGTLSALAEQVERLRRGSSNRNPSVASSSSSSSPVVRATSQQVSNQQQDASTSTPDLSSSLPDDDDDFELEHQAANKPSTSSNTLELPKSRLGSAESLMMIAVSPTGSPKPKWPVLSSRPRLAGSEVDERRLVEVSNKSTVTAIDRTLMDQMVRKFFVETREKATQSIEFDCDSDELGSSVSRPLGGAARVRPKSSTARMTSTRNVAVGTEKFSRERFSLLPPTKTRSTQTKPNMDNDIGTSETRRYKLTHLDLGPIIRGRSAEVPSALSPPPIPVTSSLPADRHGQADSTGSVGTSKDTLETEPFEKKVPIQRSSNEESVKVKLAEQAQIIPASSDKPSVLKAKVTAKDSLAGDLPSRAEFTGVSASGQVSPANSTAGSDTSGQSKTSRDSLTSRAGDNQDGAVSSQPLEQASANRQRLAARSVSLIPSVKTELRVIIEINDSKQRQRSEITSDSTFLDGKLTKTTEVNTRKQVAETPRQVLQRLQSIGREHSLLGSTGANQQRRSPAAVRSALSRAGSLSMSSLSPSPGQVEREWREVSKSSVRNEIETDTRHGQHRNSSSVGPDELSMSSKALISHLADDKSAIALKSRAARRWQPEVGKAPIERTLVESEAAFDERQADGQARQPDLASGPALARGVSSPALDRSDPPSNYPNSFVRSRSPRAEFVTKKHQPGEPADLRTSMSSQSLSSLGDGEPQTNSINRRPVDGRDQASRRNHAQVSPDKQAGQSSLQPVVRHARLEIEEKSEDRRQVTRNGQLVYDDRLRERRYERTNSSPAAPSSPIRVAPTNQGQPKPSQPGAGILRNARQLSSERQPLKPISNRTSPSPLVVESSPPPPLLFTDQNSTLSSEPETMDSGFAQSGVGSSNALNSAANLTNQVRHRLAGQATLQRVARKGISTSSPSPILADLEPNSIEFVDEGEDELIEQLDQSRLKSSVKKPKDHLASDKKG